MLLYIFRHRKDSNFHRSYATLPFQDSLLSIRVRCHNMTLFIRVKVRLLKIAVSVTNDWGEIRTLGAFQPIGIQSRRTRPTMRPSHTTQEGFEPSYRLRLPDFESGAINLSATVSYSRPGSNGHLPAENRKSLPLDYGSLRGLSESDRYSGNQNPMSCR